MRSSLRAFLVTIVLLLSTLVVIAGTAQSASASPLGGSARKLSAAEINAAVTPPGGVKATMSGGNTVDAAVRESQPRTDGYRHIDTPTLIAKLKSEGLNTFVYSIWDSPTDWSDLVNEFAPAAQAAGIRIWVYIVPPSECFANPVPVLNGRCSQPFGLDYVRWGSEVAQLSLRYPNVVALGIDDFEIGDNAKLFTPAYMQSIDDAIDAVNPRIGLYTCAYLGQALDDNFYSTYAPYIDGVIYPYLGGANNTQDASEVAGNIDAIRAHTAPLGLGLMFLVYSGRFLDAVVSPTASYVARVVAAVRPYVAAGQVMGIDLYGLPLPGKPMVAAENKAAHGIGRLSLSVSYNTATRAGDYAQAQQQISVNPLASTYTLDFSDYDQYSDDLGGAGYHAKQVLVDGQAVWSSDVTDAGGENWQHRTVDLTNALRGKTSATLAFRLYEANSVGDFPIDVGIDDVSGQGFSVANGGFEQSSGWQLATTSPGVLPMIDLAPDHDPRNVLAAAAQSLLGQQYTASGSVASEVKLTRSLASGFSTDRDAMYGNGRLQFAVPANTPTSAGACTSASQTVTVQPSARYELSFWQFVRHATATAASGTHLMRVLIDGQLVWSADAMTQIQYLWVNGYTTQGPIDVGQFVNANSGTNKLDVSRFVSGKQQVTLAFQLCEQRSVPNLAVDVGFDNIETVGLDVRNPGFEDGSAWNVSTTSPQLQADIKIAR